MFSEVVAGSAIVIFPLVGLMVFFTFMSLVYLWAFDPRKKQYFANVAASILRDYLRFFIIEKGLTHD